MAGYFVLLSNASKNNLLKVGGELCFIPSGKLSRKTLVASWNSSRGEPSKDAEANKTQLWTTAAQSFVSFSVIQKDGKASFTKSLVPLVDVGINLQGN